MAVETTSTNSNNKIERSILLAGLAILLLTLLVQLIIANREKLAKKTTLRPVISQLCVLANCQLANWRQPEAFQPIQHSVTADPRQNGVLIVQLSFKNSAAWPQPWPLIELAFTDFNGQIIGLRRFRPTEYLNAQQEPDINAGQSVSVQLAIQETASKADGFQYNFY